MYNCFVLVQEGDMPNSNWEEDRTWSEAPSRTSWVSGAARSRPRIL